MTKKQQTILVEHFYSFYDKVLEMKSIVIDKKWLSDNPEVKETPETTAQHILENIKQFLYRQSTDFSITKNHYTKEVYNEFVFVLVCLCDEIFLNISWKGTDYWKNNLLESCFFNSHTAGETIFDKIDKLTSQQKPFSKELSEIYLFALNLGFQGKYRDQKDKTLLYSYKQKLYIYVYEYHPDLSDMSHIYEDSYQQTLSQDKIRMFQDTRLWIFSIFVVFLGFLYTSYHLWYYQTHEINNTLANILKEPNQERKE